MIELWRRFRRLQRMELLGINRRNADYIIRYNRRKFFPLVDDKVKTKVVADKMGLTAPKLLHVISTQHAVEAIESLLAQAQQQAREKPQPPAHAQRVPLMDAAQLRSGLNEGRLLALYQPKVALRDHQLRGAEALARWRHPSDGLVSPACFIPLMESSDLIGELTWQMLADSAAHAWTGEPHCETGVSP